MKVLIASSSLVAQPITEWLLNSDHKVVGVLTAPDAAKGRGREIAENTFATLARTLQVPVFKAASSEEIRKAIQESEAEIVVTAAYGRLIRKRELSQPKYGWLNIHFSLLPRWRGASPIQRSIQHGDAVTGVTVFRLDEGLDTGPIYLQQQYDISSLNTGEVLDVFAKLGALAFIEVLKDISNESTPIAQSGEASLARKVLKEETEINWHTEAAFNERKIRAFTPKPGAWTNFGGKRLRIEKARLSAESGSPGTILKLDPLLVACKEGAIEILSVCPEGSRSMDAQDWIRGARISSGASFG